MNPTASILMGVYLFVAVVVLLATVWFDTLDNPYASVWDWQGWVVGTIVGLLWPALAVYFLVASFASRGK